MSFSAYKKRALDLSININHRRSSVGSCIRCCLVFSGPVGYAQMVRSFTLTHNFNKKNLSEQNIRDILEELSRLRTQSIELCNRFHEYRKVQKHMRHYQVSKKDEQYRQEITAEIESLWEKFDIEDKDSPKLSLFDKIIRFLN
jgi:hypothetical protein